MNVNPPVPSQKPVSEQSSRSGVGAKVRAMQPSDGWKPVKAISYRTTPTKDNLLSDGWSVPIKSCEADLKIGEPGLCLASISKAKKAIAELKGTHPLPILASTNINGTGEELHVLVEDPSGRWQVRRRFLFQVGTGLVTYMDGKPKKTFNPDSVKVVLNLGKHHTEPETWGHALTNAQALTKKWLQIAAKVDLFDVRPPTRFANAPDML